MAMKRCRRSGARRSEVPKRRDHEGPHGAPLGCRGRRPPGGLLSFYAIRSEPSSSDDMLSFLCIHDSGELDSIVQHQPLTRDVETLTKVDGPTINEVVIDDSVKRMIY